MYRVFVCVTLLFLANLSVQTEFVSYKTISNPTTQGQATIAYTAQGVPFITAASETDLFYAQGRIVAENRLWQMEFFRRFMLGTLSEIYGNVTLQSDINHRRMRWADICEQNIANTPQSYLDIARYGPPRLFHKQINGFSQ
jgi:acyl-homoserine lactone acylase PvdQ